MKYIARTLQKVIDEAIQRKKSVLLLGARQTGKTTLINRLKSDLYISLVRPDVRLRYEKDASILTKEVEFLSKDKKRKRPVVLLDEAQRVPGIFDVVQDLADRRLATFVLTGSSARKLRRGPNANLLPGRVVSLKLDPLTIGEYKSPLNVYLFYGSLPGIVQLTKDRDREIDLESYVTTYLEEEIRAEAIVRNVGAFARFLEFAASESGRIVNFKKLADEIGISHTTISSYYQILEDCLIAERVEPITKSRTRKKLTKANKYLIFDMGVRRIAAKEGTKLPQDYMGHLFEQFVGLELIRNVRLSHKKSKLCFWRDPDGPEVDWVLDREGEYIPIEVKLTDSPKKNDIKHLEVFLSEYSNAREGFLVCRAPRRMKLSERITAWPWEELSKLV